MDANPTTTTITQRPHLIKGEFAPVYWEPLGRRGERLVVGVLLTGPEGIAKAHVTLQHHRLLDFINKGKSESANGVIRFAFDHFAKTLNAGGHIEDLRAPFATMSIGRTEAISARDNAELLDRAMRLSTLLGVMPEPHEPPNTSSVAAKTLTFLRDVRRVVRMLDPALAKDALKARQHMLIGQSQVRLHFQHNGRYAQFCSLPLPNARVELATECQARLNDLMLIRQINPHAKVALCVNDQTLADAQHYLGKHNATLEVRQRAMDFARAMNIPLHQYTKATDAAGFLQTLAEA